MHLLLFTIAAQFPIQSKKHPKKKTSQTSKSVWLVMTFTDDSVVLLQFKKKTNYSIKYRIELLKKMTQMLMTSDLWPLTSGHFSLGYYFTAFSFLQNDHQMYWLLMMDIMIELSVIRQRDHDDVFIFVS